MRSTLLAKLIGLALVVSVQCVSIDPPGDRVEQCANANQCYPPHYSGPKVACILPAGWGTGWCLPTADCEEYVKQYGKGSKHEERVDARCDKKKE